MRAETLLKEKETEPNSRTNYHKFLLINNSFPKLRYLLKSHSLLFTRTSPLISQKSSWKSRSKQIAAVDIMCYLQETKSSKSLERLHLLKELIPNNLILQTLLMVLNVFYLSEQHFNSLGIIQPSLVSWILLLATTDAHP